MDEVGCKRSSRTQQRAKSDEDGSSSVSRESSPFLRRGRRRCRSKERKGRRRVRVSFGRYRRSVKGLKRRKRTKGEGVRERDERTRNNSLPHTTPESPSQQSKLPRGYP